MKRFLITSAAVLLALAALVFWMLQPRRTTYFTDADRIHEPAESARPRDILWQPPATMPAIVNTDADDYEPRISGDGLTLFFVRGKAGQNADILTSTRTPRGWSEPAPIAGVNSEYDDLGPEPSADGDSLYFYSDRPGGLGGYDLWVARRGEDGWREPINLGPQINSGFNDYGPCLTPDGATLYFASNRPQPADQDRPNADAWPATLREDLFHRDYDLYLALEVGKESRRLETGATPFGPAEPINALNTPHNEGSPAVSPFGDFLYFASDRPGGAGGFDLYRSRRLRGEHESPLSLGEPVNTAANELDPGLSLGGYALHFSSDRVRAEGAAEPSNRTGASESQRNYDLYFTTSREVFAEVDEIPTDWAALWAEIGPNLLWALLALLLLLLLLAMLRDMRGRKLSLLTRCLLASIAAHLLLMLLFNTWQVTASLAYALQNRNGRTGPIQVGLVQVARADELTAQIRGQLTDVAAPAPVEIQQKRVVTAPEIEADAAVTLPVERHDTDFSENPDVAVAPREMQSQPVQQPPPSPAAPDQMQVAVDVALPDERQRITDDEPHEAQNAATADAPAVARADLTVAATQPLIADARLDPPDSSQPPPGESGTSLADVGIPREASPQTSAAPNTTSGDFAAITPPVLDVALPAAESAADSTESVAVRLQPAALSSVRAPNAIGEPQAATPELAVIPPDSKPTRDDSSGPSARLPTPADVHTDVAFAPTASGDSAADAVRMPDLALPALEESSAPVAAESVGLAPRTADPAAVRSPLRDVMPGRSPPPHNLVTIQPQQTAARVPDEGPAGATSLGGVTLAPDADVRTPALAHAHTPGLPGSSPLDLRLPTEVAAPVDPYAQRSASEKEKIVERMGGSQETELAVASALRWLAAHQSPDGHWDANDFDERCGRCGGETHIEADIALTGLSLLCFLGAGHTHQEEGPYQSHVARGLGWLLEHQDPDGDLRGEETMYTQGIATIALSEAFGMTKDPALRDPVDRAVDFIVRARHRRSGGWRYEPGQNGDTSVLGWQVMALRSAALAGVAVPASAFDGARAWLDRVSTESQRGRYAYQPRQRPTPSMTAEGMYVQQLLGTPRDDPRMKESAEYLAEQLPDWDARPNTYYWYYAALALYQHGGDIWTRWNAALTSQLLTNQKKTGRAAGSWDPQGEWAPTGGRLYQTAICTLTLEVYYRYLPLYSME